MFFHDNAELFFNDRYIELFDDAFPAFLYLEDSLFFLDVYESGELHVAFGVVVFVKEFDDALDKIAC